MSFENDNIHPLSANLCYYTIFADLRRIVFVAFRCNLFHLSMKADFKQSFVRTK